MFPLFRTATTFAVLAGTSQAYAVLVLPPSSTGQFRLAFVTSTTRDAASSSIADYNAFVTAAANSQPDLASLGTTWSAIGSTFTVSARANTMTDPAPAGDTGFPIFTVTGVKIADHYDDLWDGTLDSPITFNEKGLPNFSFDFVWTGTGNTGFTLLALGDSITTIGNSISTIDTWVSISSAPSLQSKYLYGISGILTSAAVPEPSAFLCVGLIGALIGLGSLGWKKLKSNRNPN